MPKETKRSANTPANRQQDQIRNSAIFGYIALILALIIAYILIAVLRKPDQATLSLLHLTETAYRWLIASIVVILSAGWLASLYGSVVFKKYSRSIKHSQDGNALNTVSNGLIILSIVQPLNAVVGSVIAILDKHHPSWVPTLTIINNYFSMILMGTSLLILAFGAEKLYKIVSDKAKLLPQAYWVIGFIIASALYAYFIVIQPLHTPLARRSYYLPDWLLVCSIAIPYLIIWYMGISAAYKTFQYQKHVRGILYKSALKYFAAGLSVVVLASITTRIIVTISAKITQLSVGPILFIIYGLILVYAAGFILIARGASKLRKIESA